MPDLPNNDRLLLKEEQVVIRKEDGETIQLPCKVTFSLNTARSLWFEVDGFVPIQVGSTATLIFEQSGVTLQGFLTCRGREMALFVPHFSGPISVGSSNNLSEVKFGLVNFTTICSKSEGKALIRNCIDILGGGWRVLIRSRHNDRVSAEQQRLVNGYERYLSHSVTLGKEDGSEFSDSQCIQILEALRIFLSFANGQWTTFALVCGYTREKELVWQEWGNRPIESAIHLHDCWFEPWHGDAIAEAFPGFLKAWNESQSSQEAIHTAIYWYIKSNSYAVGPDGSLLLTQAALESLSQYVLVDSRRIVSKTKFKQLKASEALDRLLVELRISIQIPDTLTDLASATPAWANGPIAITTIRNSLTHSYEFQDSGMVIDSWQLAQWYLEMILLRLFEFKGMYSNRTKYGKYMAQAEPMP